MVRISRTTIIHATLMCTDTSDKSLWSMNMSHAINPEKNTPHISSGMSPEEVWKISKAYHRALQNAHTWGCPEYVLLPRLKDGNKLPKWMTRSRRDQYLGASPLNARTVVLVRNLKTGKIRPQFHLVFDDYFETVHTGEDQEPPVWS